MNDQLRHALVDNEEALKDLRSQVEDPRAARAADESPQLRAEHAEPVEALKQRDMLAKQK